jgi:hypothetical protein
MDLIPSSSDPMPDPNLPPLITFSTPSTPQPYQERILASLEDGSRLETWQERWDRERNKSFRVFATDSSIANLLGRIAAHELGKYSHNPPAWCPIAWHANPTIGRKLPARRARGRRRGNA